jgi:hypothetical protein
MYTHRTQRTNNTHKRYLGPDSEFLQASSKFLIRQRARLVCIKDTEQQLYSENELEAKGEKGGEREVEGVTREEKE